jgi:hypothetical protein
VSGGDRCWFKRSTGEKRRETRENIIITIIIGATGPTSKSPTKYVSHIPSKHDVKELQQTAILALHTYCGKYWCKVQNIEREE